MPRASPIRTSFTGGEMSPYLDGRVDIQKYATGCRVFQNFIPAVQGPAVRRPGTRYVAEVKNSANRTWLVRFEFNVSQAYILEFGDRYIRFFTQHGQLLVSGVAAYSGATTYAVGDLVSQGGVNYYCIAATTGNAPPNATFWYALTGSIYEIPTPFTVANLTNSADNTFRLSIVQSGDVLYIAHPSYPTQKLSRFAHTKWTIGNAPFVNGPFKRQNTTKTATVYASAATGSVTLTANTSMFTSVMVGSLFYMEQADLSQIKPWTAGQQFKNPESPLGALRRANGITYQCTTTGTPTAGKFWRTGPNMPIHTYGTVADGDYHAIDGTNCEREGLDWLFLNAGYGVLQITGYTSPTVVTATVVSDWQLPAGVVGSTNPTWRWALAAFSGQEGYPDHVTFFRERLTLAKTQWIYCSVAGDFDNFAARDDSGNVVADRAISVQISSDQANTVQWLVPTQSLLIGTTGGEFACDALTASDAFAPGNVKIEQQTAEGSRGVAPVRVNYSALMVQTSGRKLKEIAWHYEQNAYTSSDLSVLADHITVGGIVQLAWHKEPYVALWGVRNDGVLLGFTFNREQDVVGWHRHPMGGGGIVESIATVPGPTSDRDELWMITQRTINGATKRYVEYLDREYQTGDAQADCFYVDCGATYSGAPATTISGLSYLEGKTVQVLANGAAHPDRTVSGGAITLQRAASKVQVGLGYTSIVQPMRIEAGAGDGTSQGKTKRINKVVVRFLNTLGAKVGPDTNTLDEINFRTASDLMDAPPPLFTGDKLVEWPGDYDFDGFLMVQQDQPLPMTVVAIMPQVTTFDR